MVTGFGSSILGLKTDIMFGKTDDAVSGDGWTDVLMNWIPFPAIRMKRRTH